MARLICCCITRNRGTGSKSDGSSFLINCLRSYYWTVGCETLLTVVNDDSSDDTWDLATRWLRDEASATGWSVLHNRKHQGIGGSMNRTILPGVDDESIVVRFDDDITFNCPGWGQRILDTFAAAPPETVSLGGRQIDPRGWIICFGDRLIGPVYRHHWSQYHPDCMAAPHDDPDVLFPVHSVMGAFGAFRASALKAIGGYDPRFAKLRCETEDVHCSFLARGWHAGVRFGLDITHWSDPTFEHAAADKAWGCHLLNETWFEKWGFHRTGLTDANAFDPQLAITRLAQILKGNKFRLIERLADPDFDEIPGMTGRYTRFVLPPAERTSPPETSRPLEHVPV